MSKCVFFDADGTILDIKKGLAPDAKEVITKLNNAGHKTFLCTGRSRAFIPKEAENLGFSGMITNLGAYIEYEGKVVYDAEIPAKDAKRAIDVLRANKIVPCCEGNHAMYYDLDEYTTDVDWYADLITETLGDRLIPIKGNENNIHINKISAKRLPGCNDKIAFSSLSDIFDFIYHEGAFVGSTTECIMKGHSKGLAIASICNVLNIDIKDRIAFGDSNNDLSMFEAVGTKICMGDGSHELKINSDMVTDSMYECGLSKALKQLDLIS